MQIAQVYAGYTLGGADMLRRAMGKKKPEEMAKQRSIFVEGAKKNGHGEQQAEALFALMEKFAEYGFNKSHSAAYALVAYQTAFLKAHYPADFMAAVLSSDMDNTDKVVRFIHECRSMGTQLNAPDINLSDWNFTAHKGEIIYGMGAIKGLGDAAARDILDERKRGGAYEGLVDFLYRNTLSKTVAEACVHAGLFDFTGMDRAELLATYPMALIASKQLRKQSAQATLFDFELPPAPRKKVDKMEVDIRLNGERKVLGLYLTGHPYARFAPMLEKSMTGSLSQVLANAEDETIEGNGKWQTVTIAGLISDVDVRSNTRGNYAFFKLDDNTARIDCSIFSKAYHDFQAFIKDDNMVVMKGWVKVNPKSGNVSLSIDVVQPLQSFMENQQGQFILTMNEKESPAKIVGLLHAVVGTQDEGNISFSVRSAADGEIVELPLPGISYASPTIKTLQERFGDRATIEYASAELRRAYRKQATDIEPLRSVEDLESLKSSLRRDLEQFLDAAASVMSRSVEMTP